jgi:hypothetical protein
MKKLILLSLLAILSNAHAAELITFGAGDAIQSSEINGNFAELEARLNALESQISAAGGLPGEPFNYVLGLGGSISLGAQFNYFVTDVILEMGAGTMTCTGTNGQYRALYLAELAGNTIGSITRVQPVVGGAYNGSCAVTGSHISLSTPIVIPASETISWNGAPGYIRLIGYKKAL